MNRRAVLTGGGLMAVGGALAVVAAKEPRKHRSPTMRRLIYLAEHGSEKERIHYGRILAKALSETGRIAYLHFDDTVSLYEADAIFGADGQRSWAWSKTTVRGDNTPVPANLLRHFD